MSLRISLRDGEKMIINGAVVSAVGRALIVVENHASILRGSEVMAPDEATTPARRLYYACMMAYIDDGRLGEHQNDIVMLLHALLDALQSEEAKATCIRFAGHVAMLDFYRALAECRNLIAYEAHALHRFEERAA